MEKETKFSILVGLFVMALTTSALIGVKIIPLWGIFFSATAITFPITFLVTDIISEVWGEKKAHQVVWIGFFTVIIAYILVFIAIKLPAAPIWQGQEAYAQTLGLVGRIVFGGLIAYIISQHHDVWAFHFWKRKTNNKYLWFRNNASTVMSQLINTIIFVSIVFYGVLPNSALIPTMVGHFLIKVIFAIADTPFVYLGTWWAK
jgi:queuosine precursor transporter